MLEVAEIVQEKQGGKFMVEEGRRNGLSALGWGFRGIWRGFEVFADFTDRFWTIFGVGLLIAMWGFVMVDSIATWLNITSLGWSMEIVGFMVAWSIFIMAGPVARANENIKVTYFPEKLLGVKKGAAFMNASESIFGLGLSIYMTVHAYRFIDQTHHLNWMQQSIEGWYYPMWIVRSAILIAFLFSSVYYFERVVKWIRSIFIEGATVDGNPPAGVGSDEVENGLIHQAEEKN